MATVSDSQMTNTVEKRSIASRTRDVSDAPGVYQSMAEVNAAIANNTLEASKTQFMDKETGRIFFLCFK